uniref:Transmembrane 9 superfamily member n=1 Tax=Romanomermis culicivorax TaxID=13658 RepID=A0A915I5Y9_ROMCU
MVAMIMLRTVHRDIARYNQTNADDAQEEFGWKLVHGDVFRPPKHGMLLSVFLGSGSQLFCMCSVTLVFACLGFLSPANRGALMTCAIVLYIFFGVIAGYVAARIYKNLSPLILLRPNKSLYPLQTSVHRYMSVHSTFRSLSTIKHFCYRQCKNPADQTNICNAATKMTDTVEKILAKRIVFAVFFVCNLIMWVYGSSAAIPFSTLIALLSLWLGISIPLTFVGAFFGFKKRPIEHPVRTNQIPRQVPEQTCYTKPVPGMLMGGILPFGSLGKCDGQDYHWWWRSFLTSGFTAVYLFLYCMHYFTAKLAISGFISTVLYFSYSFIMVFIFFLVTVFYADSSASIMILAKKLNEKHPISKDQRRLLLQPEFVH